MKCVLITAMLAMCTAAQKIEDLTGKILVFPKESPSDHVKVNIPQKELKAITVCLRSFTDLNRNHGLFSMATPGFSNAFLIFKSSTTDQIELNTKNKAANMYAQDYKRNTWQTVCATWDGTTGLMQLWLNGQQSSRKSSSDGVIRPNFVITLGQEQDSHGGGFDAQQTFVGMLRDVNMWDYVLSSCEILRYGDDLNYTPGNLINWKEFNYEIVGRILLVGDKSDKCSCQIKKMPSMYGQTCRA